MYARAVTPRLFLAIGVFVTALILGALSIYCWRMGYDRAAMRYALVALFESVAALAVVVATRFGR